MLEDHYKSKEAAEHHIMRCKKAGLAKMDEWCGQEVYPLFIKEKSLLESQAEDSACLQPMHVVGTVGNGKKTAAAAAKPKAKSKASQESDLQQTKCYVHVQEREDV
eukprot:5169538-Amphidinium_carterae.1